MMLNLTDGYVVWAFRHLILYFDASKYFKDDTVEKDKEKDKIIEIQEEQIGEARVNEDQKIICLPELNDYKSYIVVEDMKTREISFLAFTLIDDEEQKDQKKVCLIGLSIKDSKLQGEHKSPLVKFRATASKDEVTGQWSVIGLALRLDGSVEVYADFIYADRIYDETRQCVDIEVGNRSFFFKMERNQQTLQEGEDINQIKDRDFQYMRAAKRWQNRIGTGTIQEETIIDTWDEVIHERVSHYVKLFIDIRTIATFIVVAHRNLLSLYDVGDNDSRREDRSGNIDRWVDTIQVHKEKDFIRSLAIKKRARVNRGTEKKSQTLVLKKSTTMKNN